MPELDGTQTHANLKAAFALASQANRRLLWFAQAADVEGHPETAALFRSVAEGEGGHAVDHLEWLSTVGDPVTGTAIGDTTDNLLAAIAGETAESEQLYPAFAQTARDEGLHDIADWFDTLIRIEQSHVERLQRGLENLR